MHVRTKGCRHPEYAVRFKKSERQKLVHDTCLREGFRMTARCALYYKMCHFSSNAILAREIATALPLHPSRVRARLQICDAKFSGKHVWCIIGIEPSCTRERLAVPSPF